MSEQPKGYWEQLFFENLARAEKAEATLESVQKMADHWEAKAAEWKARAEKVEFSLSNREIWIMNANTAFDAAAVETHHPLAFGMRKPMALVDRVKWLAKSRDDLQARAEKAEAALESAQKMADHWEKKTAYWKLRAKEAETARSNRSVLLGKMESALNAADVETHHPDRECAARKPMMPHERIEWLCKDRDNWKSRAKEAEAERDEWKRRAGNAEFEVKRQKDLANPVDWERVRIESAMLILRLLPSNSVGDGIIEEVTKGAVKWANALIAELQKKEVQG